MAGATTWQRRSNHAFTTVTQLTTVLFQLYIAFPKRMAWGCGHIPKAEKLAIIRAKYTAN